MRLWSLVGKTVADPCFAIDVARQLQGTASHALGYAWLASATLAEALERLARYVRIATELWKPRIEDEPDGVRVTFVFARDDLPIGLYDVLPAALVRMCRISFGDTFAPLAVTLVRACPACTRCYEDWFKAAIEWGASAPGILCRREDRARPLPTTNPDIARACDRVALDYLARLDRDDIRAQVRQRLVEALPSGATTVEGVARRLALSPRTLHRRLAEAGTSFAELRDEARHTLAAEYLRGSALTVAEIAYLLGFAEVSSFNRAFRRWTGQQPGAIRREHQAKLGDGNSG